MLKCCFSASDGFILQNELNKTMKRFSSLSARVFASVFSLMAVSCYSPLLPDDEKPDDGKDVEPAVTPTDTLPATDTVAIVHSGADGDPYTVAEAQVVAFAREVWVEGYVVGTVKGSMATGCQWETPFTVSSNILLADTFPAFYYQCMPVELKEGSLYQYGLSLVHNPDILHERRRVKGDIDTYFRVPGIRNVKIVSKPRADDSDDNPIDSVQAGESIAAPLSVAEAIAAQGDGNYAAVKWVTGYIVGISTGKNAIVLLDSVNVNDVSVNSNVLLADSIGESEKVIAVKLSSGCIREDVNLADHPENLWKRLTVNGTLKPYNNLPGVVDVLGTGRRTDAKGNPLYLLE